MRASWRLLAALLSGPVALVLAWVVIEAAQATGVVVPPDAGTRFRGPQGREADVTEILVTRDQSGGSLGLFRQSIAPKSGPPAHVHRSEDEFIYLVSGQLKVQIGDRVTEAPARSVLFVPRGTRHAFVNVGTEPAVLLAGVTPGGFEKMFQAREGVDAATNQALMKTHNM